MPATVNDLVKLDGWAGVSLMPVNTYQVDTIALVLGDYTTDFCAFLRFIEPVGIDEIRVLDGTGGWISHGFDEVFSICRVTVPAI